MTLKELFQAMDFNTEVGVIRDDWASCSARPENYKDTDVYTPKRNRLRPIFPTPIYCAENVSFNSVNCSDFHPELPQGYLDAEVVSISSISFPVWDGGNSLASKGPDSTRTVIYVNVNEDLDDVKTFPLDEVDDICVPNIDWPYSFDYTRFCELNGEINRILPFCQRSCLTWVLDNGFSFVREMSDDDIKELDKNNPIALCKKYVEITKLFASVDEFIDFMWLSIPKK